MTNAHGQKTVERCTALEAQQRSDSLYAVVYPTLDTEQCNALGTAQGDSGHALFLRF